MSLIRILIEMKCIITLLYRIIYDLQILLQVATLANLSINYSANIYHSNIFIII